jgi:hypothetical protein
MLRIVVIALTVLANVPWAHATGVDGAGRVVIVPLVVSLSDRQSEITITNAGPGGILIHSVYVGAEGTMLAASTNGVITCVDQEVPPQGSVSVLLSDLCPDVPMPNLDGNNFGYLELTSDDKGDPPLFYASSTVDNGSESFGIAGQPAGAFDPASTTGLRVLGLRTDGSFPRAEDLTCYVATLNEGKTIRVSLFDGASKMLGTNTVTLAARRMRRLDIPTLLRLGGNATRTNLWADFASSSPGLLIAGCAIEQTSGGRIAYQPGQTPRPTDRARLRNVYVSADLHPGPFNMPAPFAWHQNGPQLKTILTTYLRTDDIVRCRFEAPDYFTYQCPAAFPFCNGPKDPSPWYEIQMRAPDGRVIAGPGVSDTGYFHTGHRGQYPAAAGQRWQIELSWNEAMPNGGWPFSKIPGHWGLRCESAAGMSEPLPLQGGPDDF